MDASTGKICMKRFFSEILLLYVVVQGTSEVKNGRTDVQFADTDNNSGRKFFAQINSAGMLMAITGSRSKKFFSG